jgi:uncharacterized membrane protein
MHAVIATAALPLFVGALLSDWAYYSSHQVQWLNFSSWLIAGALLLLGLALLWGLVGTLVSRAPAHRRGKVYLVLLLAGFLLGFFNALVHARDGWATMPTGLVLSVVVLVLAAAGAALGLAGLQRRAAP